MDNENEIINYEEGKSDLMEYEPSDCLDEKELYELGYRRMTSDEEKIYSGLLQPFIHDVVNHYNDKNISKQFKDAVSNSYFLHIDKELNVNVHLANSGSLPGAYKGLLKDNETNKIVGHADWVKNESELNISKIPNLVHGAMDILAKVTNQYFLSQINNKFAHIDEKLNQILNLLKADRESEIKHTYKQIKKIENSLEIILKNDEMRHDERISLKSYINNAGKNMEFYKDEIDGIRKSISEKTKGTDLQEKFDSLFDSLKKYDFCVKMSLEATFLLIILYRFNDINDIEGIRNELSNEIKILNNYLDCLDEWMDEMIEKNKELSSFITRKKIPALLKMSFSAKIDEIIYGERVYSPQTIKFYKKMHEDKQMVKEKRSSISKEIKAIKSFGTSYVNAIDDYVKVVTNGTCFAVLDGKYYTTCPTILCSK